MKQKFCQRNIALTQEHGSWVFLFSPLLIGLFVNQNWAPGMTWFTVSAVALFLLRNPITMAVKVFAGRRGQGILPAIWFWTGIYSAILVFSYYQLWQFGLGWVAVLAIPGILIFTWYLWLVYQRKERRKILLDFLASGVLALSAAGAYWSSLGQPEVTGWLLFGLAWLQSGASIVYAALRLNQRTWKQMPSPSNLLTEAKSALIFTTGNVLISILFSYIEWMPRWAWLPFLIQWFESMYGIFHPAIGSRPNAIGIRQLIISSLFTISFISLWRI